MLWGKAFPFQAQEEQVQAGGGPSTFKELQEEQRTNRVTEGVKKGESRRSEVRNNGCSRQGTDPIDHSNQVKNHIPHCFTNGYVDIYTSIPLKHGAMTNLVHLTIHTYARMFVRFTLRIKSLLCTHIRVLSNVLVTNSTHWVIEGPCWYGHSPVLKATVSLMFASLKDPHSITWFIYSCTWRSVRRLSILLSWFRFSVSVLF